MCLELQVGSREALCDVGRQQILGDEIVKILHFVGLIVSPETAQPCYSSRKAATNDTMISMQ